MSYPNDLQQNDFIKTITNYVKTSSGLALVSFDQHMEISQRLDGKCLPLYFSEIQDVIERIDTKGVPFLQINYSSNRKILLTDSLVGFRPTPVTSLDMSKLPKVVTTPDIVSVFEAIQEALHSGVDEHFEEIEVLRRVFDAVVSGGEEVGFKLTREREWLSRVPAMSFKGSA